MHNLIRNLPVIHKDKKIIHAINKITKSKIKILFVIDEKKKIVGSISSGDLRRSVAKKIDLNERVIKIMFTKPKFFFKKPEDSSTLKDLICVPLVNKKKQIIDVIHNKKLIKDKNNTIFIMAGGKGIRLLPLTKKIPKPMLTIKGIPIIERIIINFKKQGFKNFLISVNYLGHKIKKHLCNGEKLKVNINYINEHSFLGTAGSLSLIDFKKTQFPIIVTNSDLITEIDYDNLIKYHNKKKSDLTVCGKNKIFQLPYGEILQKSEKINKIVEKPNISHLVNAGTYVMNKDIIKNIRKNKKLMMNDLISQQIKKNKKIYCYPVYENWIDIGNKNDYSKNK